MHKTRLVLFSLTLLIGVLFVAKAIINLKKPNSSQPAITISPIPSSPTPAKTIPVPVFNSIKIDKNELNVEIALTPEEIQQGLSGRNEIGSDGMLFVIKPPRQTAFWMKDMLFPLDIVWISNNKIIGIEKNIPMPPTNATDDKLPLYNSPSMVDYVLELPAGTTSELKITLSSEITIPTSDLIIKN
ncbi:MAG: DUF192 domain-containing protein [Patescibacteria group bacterium]